MPARCFAYARKVFCVCSQGCLIPSRTLREGFPFLFCSLREQIIKVYPFYFLAYLEII